MPRNPEYQTKQKANILRFLEANADRHITAGELQISLAGAGTPIGAATVYRQLERLESQGIVRRYLLDDRGGACWQYIGAEAARAHCREHFHLKCTVCGVLMHLDCGHLTTIREHVAQDHGFVIDPSRTIFYGVCAKCSEQGKRE